MDKENTVESAVQELIKAIKVRRINVGLKEGEHGELLVISDNENIEAAISDYQNEISTDIAMGTWCPGFIHRFEYPLPAIPDNSDAVKVQIGPHVFIIRVRKLEQMDTGSLLEHLKSQQSL